MEGHREKGEEFFGGLNTYLLACVVKPQFPKRLARLLMRGVLSVTLIRKIQWKHRKNL
jgi:hypothetical protein